jgi:hypothetical protein
MFIRGSNDDYNSDATRTVSQGDKRSPTVSDLTVGATINNPLLGGYS